MEKKSTQLIYISGKITGIESDAKKLFEDVENDITRLGFGIPINPFKLNDDHDKSWNSYMSVCIEALFKCDMIIMLENWKESKGAMIEHDIAKGLGLKIMYTKF